MIRRFPLALFGLETRYVARLYLLHTLLVAALVLALVLALDLAGRFDRVLSAEGIVETPDGALRLVYYLWLRAAYNLPAILPIALAIGILWVEVRLTQGYERSMIANTGRAPGLSLVPALVVGLAVGLGQYALQAHVRPYAVAAQGEAGFRFYGSRFRAGTAPRAWRDFGDTLIYAGIRFAADGPVLVNARLFLFDADDRLLRVIWTDAARPTEAGLMLEGDHASWPAEGDTGALVPLMMNADWLSYAGVAPRFLPQPVLRRIAAAESGVPTQGAYRAALHERWAAIAGSLALALLVAALSLRWMAARRGLLVPLVIVGAAYSLHIAGNVFSALGEYERLSPLTAAWGLPVVLLAGCGLVLGVEHWRVRGRLRALRQDE
ncbi:MAG: LptF/LptG family permease [Rhodobacteraceae bacterium]|nr:LptF/LptG family permease [Paracoccaceae bacterium]